MSAPAPILRRDALSVELLHQVGPERDRCERELLAAGISLPLPHRGSWARLQQSAESWFLVVRDRERQCLGGFAVAVFRSHALPGHLILRAERFGHSLPASVRDIATEALLKLGRDTPRILRIYVESYALDPAVRDATTTALQACGFHQAEEPRRYANTIAIDLTPDEDAILASFHPTARKNLKAAAKRPVEVRQIQDESLASRMKELDQETRVRTGGTPKYSDWAVSMELSRQLPSQSRLVGLFRTDVSGPAALLAFAWGCGHGDYAHYDAAASTRQTDLRIPLAYPLIWDLACWAKRNGARWFDLGGITQGHLGSNDPLGGISDFKRYFSRTVVNVGQEWVVEPHWIRARLARAVVAGASLVTGVRSALTRSRKVTPPPALQVG